MRRHWFCLAILPALLLSPLFAARTHTRAVKRHAASGSAQRKSVGRHAALRSAKSSRVAGAAALRRARSGSIHLHTTAPVVTALIDPVPRGRFPFLAPLKGSHDSLVRQNVRSEADGLRRIQDDTDLLAQRRSGELVAVPATAALVVDERLPANRRYCRAWAAQFLTDISRVHYGRFRRSLQVNSAVRTVEYQRHLEMVNGNAAPAVGEDASPHLTGATVDIAKKGLSIEEIGWMRAYLAPLQAAGKIDVEEEFYQACFHITVYRSYRPAQSSPAEAKGGAHGGSAAMLAARVR